MNTFAESMQSNFDDIFSDLLFSTNILLRAQDNEPPNVAELKWFVDKWKIETPMDIMLLAPYFDPYGYIKFANEISKILW